VLAISLNAMQGSIRLFSEPMKSFKPLFMSGAKHVQVRSMPAQEEHQHQSNANGQHSTAPKPQANVAAAAAAATLDVSGASIKVQCSSSIAVNSTKPHSSIVTIAIQKPQLITINIGKKRGQAGLNSAASSVPAIGSTASQNLSTKALSRPPEGHKKQKHSASASSAASSKKNESGGSNNLDSRVEVDANTYCGCVR
jgi:hypothetical protein